MTTAITVAYLDDDGLLCRTCARERYPLDLADAIHLRVIRTASTGDYGCVECGSDICVSCGGHGQDVVLNDAGICQGCHDMCTSSDPTQHDGDTCPVHEA